MRLRQSNRWEPVTRRVLRLVGSAQTDEQTAGAAVLDAGRDGRMSHTAAAAWWGVGASYRLIPPHALGRVGRVTHRGELGTIHPLTGITDRWLTTLRGIPVVRPELCIYQLAGSVHQDRAERALDAAWARGLLSGASIRECLNDLAEHGRNGTVVLRSLLDARPLDYVPPASGLEGRFKKIIEGLALGGWRRQVDSGGDTWAGRVDVRHETLPLIVEIQSEEFHSSLSSAVDDAKRRAKLEAAGFVVVEVWDTDVWHNPSVALASVRAGVREAQRRRAA